jgi:transcriptional regulator with XRE-family HTH domain
MSTVNCGKVDIIMESVTPVLTLKELIARANTTQRDLAKKTGISERSINEWVARKYIPRFDNAIAVSRELGISLKTLANSIGLDTTGIPDDRPPE